MNTIIDKDMRSISISYKEEDEIENKKIFQAIVNIAYEEKLNCNFGETNKVRYFYLSGISSQHVKQALKRIEKL